MSADPTQPPVAAPAGMLVLPQELTHRQATACLAMLRHGLGQQRDGSVLIDASALTTFDSSALAVLLECRREAVHRGKGFAIKGVPAPLAGLAGRYGVRDLLGLQAAPAMTV